MRVVDTSAWIEWVAGSVAGRSIGPEIATRDNDIVPTIVQYELANWAARELSVEQADSIIADSTRCVVVQLSTELALEAARVRHLHKLATADAIIYATALAHDADILTCDAHFEGLPNVIDVPKA